jgi:hypothetical protein
MPAIKARKQADGSVRYTAVVRIRRQGKVLHQEAKTFAHRSAAERWGKHREVQKRPSQSVLHRYAQRRFHRSHRLSRLSGEVQRFGQHEIQAQPDG